jgi:hypothetical protein
MNPASPLDRASTWALKLSATRRLSSIDDGLLNFPGAYLRHYLRIHPLASVWWHPIPNAAHLDAGSSLDRGHIRDVSRVRRGRQTHDERFRQFAHGADRAGAGNVYSMLLRA